jgi:hypothetical protein
MIDLSKPIRTKDGREAKYLGNSSSGHHVFEIVFKQACDPKDLEKEFENTPLAPPKLTGFCPLSKCVELGHSRSRQDCMKYYPDSEWLLDLSTLTEKNFIQIKGN